MIEWLQSFYSDPSLRAQMVAAFSPVFLGYAASVVDNPSEEFVGALVLRFVERYLDSSRAQLQEVVTAALDAGEDPLAAVEQRFGEWVEKRPGKVSMNEIVRTENATRLQDMRDQGVTRKVWRVRSPNCPYCKTLDGKTISVEEPFFRPNDEFQPEGAERALRFNSDKRHPPIHNGCDCYIEAVTE